MALFVYGFTCTVYTDPINYSSIVPIKHTRIHTPHVARQTSHVHLTLLRYTLQCIICVSIKHLINDKFTYTAESVKGVPTVCGEFDFEAYLRYNAGRTG